VPRPDAADAAPPWCGNRRRWLVFLVVFLLRVGVRVRVRVRVRG